MRKPLLILALLAVPALAAAGCGDNGEAASEASELVPAGAIVYGEANIRPEGDQKAAIDSILSKFPGGGQAGDKLEDLIEKGLRESDAPLSFKQDVEPWLGDEVAFFVGGVSGTGQLEASAGLIAADDEGKAQDALEKSAEGKSERHSYRDVDYLTDESGDAGAVFDGFLVLGTEAGVKAAIDASKGDGTLSDDDDFTKATERAASDRLGLVYVDSRGFLEGARQSGAPVPDSFKKFFQEPVVATFDADDDGVQFEAKLSQELAKSFAFLGQGSDLLGEPPADSWLALGQKDFGKLIDFYADVAGGVAGGRDVVEQQFKAATGLDLRSDVLSWMGDFGIFVRGTKLSNLDGALVVLTSDEDASARFLAALARLARSQANDPSDRVEPLSAPGGGRGFTLTTPDIPKPIHAFVRSGKVVFAYGDAAAKDAIDPGDTLGDSPAFTAARDSLGDYDVSVYVLFKPILDLVDSTSAGSDPDWQQAKPYLEPLSALVGGTSGGGDELRSAFKLVVK